MDAMGWRRMSWVIGIALLVVDAMFDYTPDFWWTAGVTLYVMITDSVLARVRSGAIVLPWARNRALLGALAAPAVAAVVLSAVLGGHRAWELAIAISGCYLLVARAGDGRRERPEPVD
jgi:hypothetical protein